MSSNTCPLRLNLLSEWNLAQCRSKWLDAKELYENIEQDGKLSSLFAENTTNLS